jgi:hypothetical protein
VKWYGVVAVFIIGIVFGLGSGACWLDGAYFRCGHQKMDFCRHDTR